MHLVCPAHKHFMKNLSKLDVPLQLETAGGDLTLDTIGDLFCGGIVCRGCVFNHLLTVSLFSTSRGEKDGYFYERCPEGNGVLKGPTGNVKLERSGGLDYLVGGEERSAFPALLTLGSVDGGCCRKDNVDIEHLRGGHLEFDPGCSTCTSMTMRGRQHRRQDDRETAGARGEVCADLTGRLPVAYNGSEYPLVALRRETRFGFVKALTNKRSETVKEAMVDMQLLLRGLWPERTHCPSHYDWRLRSKREQFDRRECWCSKTRNSMSLASSKCTCELVARCCGTRKRSLQSQQTTSTWTERHGGTDRVGETCLFRTSWMRPVAERETKLVATLGLSGICNKTGTSHGTSRKFGACCFAKKFCWLE